MSSRTTSDPAAVLRRQRERSHARLRAHVERLPDATRHALGAHPWRTVAGGLTGGVVLGRSLAAPADEAPARPRSRAARVFAGASRVASVARLFVAFGDPTSGE